MSRAIETEIEETTKRERKQTSGRSLTLYYTVVLPWHKPYATMWWQLRVTIRLQLPFVKRRTMHETLAFLAVVSAVTLGIRASAARRPSEEAVMMWRRRRP